MKTRTNNPTVKKSKKAEQQQKRKKVVVVEEFNDSETDIRSSASTVALSDNEDYELVNDNLSLNNSNKKKRRVKMRDGCEKEQEGGSLEAAYERRLQDLKSQVKALEAQAKEGQKEGQEEQEEEGRSGQESGAGQPTSNAITAESHHRNAQDAQSSLEGVEDGAVKALLEQSGLSATATSNMFGEAGSGAALKKPRDVEVVQKVAISKSTDMSLAKVKYQSKWGNQREFPVVMFTKNYEKSGKSISIDTDLRSSLNIIVSLLPLAMTFFLASTQRLLGEFLIKKFMPAILKQAANGPYDIAEDVESMMLLLAKMTDLLRARIENNQKKRAEEKANHQGGGGGQNQLQNSALNFFGVSPSQTPASHNAPPPFEMYN